MADSQCPICFEKLEVRDVAPCFDCGWDATELDHLAAGKHTYTEVLAFGIPIVGEFVEVREITNPLRGKDKFCPTCRRRLAFLKFLAQVRASGSDWNEEAT